MNYLTSAFNLNMRPITKQSGLRLSSQNNSNNSSISISSSSISSISSSSSSNIGNINNNYYTLPVISTECNKSSAIFSRKVFVGGLPPDLDQERIASYFQIYGTLIVDWPHKSEAKSIFPPKGYVFVIFDKEESVQRLISCCRVDKDKYYLSISSDSFKDKPIQIRPWCILDTDFTLNTSQSVDLRKSIFVGGVPRPLRASELAMIMDKLYGGVCHASIDTDSELKYPKGAGRVSFTNQQSYVAAISSRFVQLKNGDVDKRAEIKPYVLDDQTCDFCSNSKSAPYFCAHTTCLQYYCETCWSLYHMKAGREFHKPMVKEGTDRPRAIPFKWC